MRKMFFYEISAEDEKVIIKNLYLFYGNSLLIYERRDSLDLKFIKKNIHQSLIVIYKIPRFSHNYYISY
jgi:hypothetical protein